MEKWRVIKGKNRKDDIPENLIMVWVKGFDFRGEWNEKAMRKDYKKPPAGVSKKIAKKAFRCGFRWVDDKGISIEDQAVCEWKYIDTLET